MHPGPYDDPYNLQDEGVRFKGVQIGAGWVDCFNAGVQAAQSDIIHVLVSGTEVADRWTDHAITQFDDPRVGTVVPVIVDQADPRRILSTGVQMTLGGSRRHRCADCGYRVFQSWASCWLMCSSMTRAASSG